MLGFARARVCSIPHTALSGKTPQRARAILAANTQEPHLREQLIHVLTEAAEIEHNLLCSYLYAAFSLKRGIDEGLTPTEAAAVSRWRKSVMSVALEEMAHLALVNNLLVFIGGSPHFNRPNFPVPPGYHPAGFSARLTPFDADTLEHFLYV